MYILNAFQLVASSPSFPSFGIFGAGSLMKSVSNVFYALSFVAFVSSKDIFFYSWIICSPSVIYNKVFPF